MNNNPNKNKDLILREKLALQRTELANQSTFLSFLRTSMYFLMAGLTIQNLFTEGKYVVFEILLFFISGIVIILGLLNYYRHKKIIQQSEKHIGDYKADYLNE